jgi:hypothetical protein
MNDGSSKDPAAGDPDELKRAQNSPASKAEAGWEMPAPIFRVSEGVPVKKHVVPEVNVTEAGMVSPDLPADPPPMPPVAEPGTKAPAPAVDTPKIVPAPKKGTSVIGLVFTAFGFVAITLFLIVVAALIYFLFFYRSGSGSVFN